MNIIDNNMMKLNDNKIVFGLEILKFWFKENLCFYSM